MNQLVSEFHERLKRNVRRDTCDLMSPEKSEQYAATLNEQELRSLVQVLNAELHQVVATVNNAK